MPLTNYAFQQLIDFTRTSSATFVGSNGLIQNTPASVNLLTWTQEFANAAWVKSFTTATENNIAAPDGTMTADFIVPNTTGGVAHSVVQTVLHSATSNTISVYVKAGEYPKFAMRENTTLGNYATFNLSTGVVIETNTTALIQDVGNGWYRCSLNYTAAAVSQNMTLFVLPAAYTSGPPHLYLWAGNGTSGLYLWGAQDEIGSTATTYTRNNGGRFPPRFDYDPVTLAPKGILIEEQRTNLLLYSQDMFHAGYNPIGGTRATSTVVGPDGATNLAQFTATATGGNRLQCFQNVTSGVTYTLSVVMSAGTSNFGGIVAAISAVAGSIFNLTGNGSVVSTAGTSVTASIQKLSATLFRCSMTFPATATGLCLLGWGVSDGTTYGSGIYPSAASGFVYGSFIQLEVGAFATSYIPTVASQVTRTADQASIVAPMFAPWYNQSEGTFVVEVLSANGLRSESQGLFSLNDGTASNVMNAARLATGVARFNGTGLPAGDVTSVSTVANGVVSKMAFAFKVNDWAMSLNGAAVVTDTSAVVPSVSRLGIGSLDGLFDGGAQWGGHIRRITYYPVRLTDAQLQALTA